MYPYQRTPYAKSLYKPYIVGIYGFFSSPRIPREHQLNTMGTRTLGLHQLAPWNKAKNHLLLPTKISGTNSLASFQGSWISCAFSSYHTSVQMGFDPKNDETYTNTWIHMYTSGQIIIFHRHPSSRALGPLQARSPNMRPQIQTRKSPMKMTVSFHCLCNFPLLRKRWWKFETTSLICALPVPSILAPQKQIPSPSRRNGPQATGRYHALGVPEAEWAPSPSGSGVRNHLRS